MPVEDQALKPSTASSPFHTCFERLARARIHRNHISSTSNAWGSPHSDKLIQANVRDSEGSVTSTPQALPVDASLELGEFLYQLRAALDGAVYAAAILDSGLDTPENENQLEFPVCEKPADFRKSSTGKRDKLHGVGTLRRAVVESAQPYDGRIDVRLGALKTLHDWARRDRHRFPRIVAAMFVNPQVLLNYPEPMTVEWSVPREMLGQILFEIGRVDFKVTGATVDTAANWYGSGQTMILVDSGDYAQRQPLVGVFDDMLISVKLVLESLEAGAPISSPRELPARIEGEFE